MECESGGEANARAPTLVDGDDLLVHEYAFRVRRHVGDVTANQERALRAGKRADVSTLVLYRLLFRAPHFRTNEVDVQ